MQQEVILERASLIDLISFKCTILTQRKLVSRLLSMMQLCLDAVEKTTRHGLVFKLDVSF